MTRKFRKKCEDLELITNKDLFLKDKDGNLARDSTNSLIKVNYENLEG